MEDTMIVQVQMTSCVSLFPFWCIKTTNQNHSSNWFLESHISNKQEWIVLKTVGPIGVESD